MKNYYKILEISQNATYQEIKSAYRKVALKYHPDVNHGDINAENRFKLIQEAYDVLSDENKRKHYDSSFESKNTTKPYENNNHTQPVTPSTLLAYFKDLNQNILNPKEAKINTRTLYNSIKAELSDENLLMLYNWNDITINTAIIEQVLLCCKPLAYDKHPTGLFPYIEEISAKLLILADSDINLKEQITGFVKKQKKTLFWENNKPEVIGATLFVIIGVLFFLNIDSIRPSKDKDRPLSGDIQPLEANEPNEIDNSNTTADRKDINSEISNNNYYYSNYANIDLSNLPDNDKGTYRETAIDYSNWETTNYSTGSIPVCFNITPKYDKTLDNYLKVIVGAGTDVVIKLCTISDDKCIRLVYVRGDSYYEIKNIPEEKYYLKLAYGLEWREKLEDGNYIGLFTKKAVYKRGDEILDFTKQYDSANPEIYSLPSYTLHIDLLTSKSDNKFKTNYISAEEFNR